MRNPQTLSLPPLYLARHAETVFNAAARMQGQDRHTPLTHAGLAQAHAMGVALRELLGEKPDLLVWASTAGRTQQTAAIICEHLSLDFFDVRLDARLQEIHVGAWEGRRYADIVAEAGPIIDPARRLFSMQPPGGEWYPDIADRLTDWLGDLAKAGRPALAISHGIASRVLRGLMVGGEAVHPGGTPVADDLPQGTIVKITGASEEAIHMGSGSSGTHRQGF